MKFDYNALVLSLQEQFGTAFTGDGIRELLDLGEEFGKDTPLSTGKRLEINYISFSGKKVTEEQVEYSGQGIAYSQEIHSGLNIWIADNLRGKSSIFKIIKFALTGSNSLKQNISKWLEHILVVFSINDKKYSIYINIEKKSPRAILFNRAVDHFPAENEFEADQLFQTKTYEELEDQLEDFFFRQFSYYSLKWTQKPSQKDNDGLLEVGTSWKTYFKSIFLESKDSGSLMYGDQGKKVFQMLLGLYLTYPINKLTVERDKLLHLKGRQQSFNDRQDKDLAERKAGLEGTLLDLEKKLGELAALEMGKVDTSSLINEYKNTLAGLNAENARVLRTTRELQAVMQEQNRIDSKRANLDGELRRVQKELQKAVRQETDIAEYLEIGVFFSNLDLKHCPSCNHTISSDKKHDAAKGHICALCTDDISSDDNGADTETLRHKASSLGQLKNGLVLQIGTLNEEIAAENKKFQLASDKINQLERQKADFKDTSAMSEKLRGLEEALNAEREKLKPGNGEKERLVAQKAVVEFQISQYRTRPAEVAGTAVEQKIILFNAAIQQLVTQRFQEGEKILKRLAELMLGEVRSLGLRISDIVINDKFDIQYKQDGDYLSFEDIAEGEQLRAKLAFYLSLIQLDIEYNFGRHTRFLIIDSPGKEEGDRNYLQGLTTVLQGIESRFGKNLQILVGTAERSLENVIEQQFVFPNDTFVF
jgi:hypothetical protein